MDILVGIPAGDETRRSFSEIKSFAQKFSSGFKLGNNNVRLGMFSYSDTAKPLVQVADGISSTTINNAIQRMTNSGGGNRKDTAIRFASQMFGRSARAGVPQSLVLVNSGRSSTGSADLSTISESFPEMDIYPVAVGTAARTESARISNKFVSYNDFSELASSGPFGVTDKIVQAGLGGSATTGGGGGGGATGGKSNTC